MCPARNCGKSGDRGVSLATLNGPFGNLLLFSAHEWGKLEWGKARVRGWRKCKGKLISTLRNLNIQVSFSLKGEEKSHLYSSKHRKTGSFKWQVALK